MLEYIERRTVVDAIADLMATGFVEDRFIMPSEIQALQNEFETLPASDVAKIKHAHWIIWEPPEELKDRMQRRYVCSECERSVAFILHGIEPLPPVMFGRLIYQYCPHCGAKMDGGDVTFVEVTKRGID